MRFILWLLLGFSVAIPGCNQACEDDEKALLYLSRHPDEPVLEGDVALRWLPSSDNNVIEVRDENGNLILETSSENGTCVLVNLPPGTYYNNAVSVGADVLECDARASSDGTVRKRAEKTRTGKPIS